MPWMVMYYPKDGRPPSQGWSPTRRKFDTIMGFGIYIELRKLIIGWSPTNPKMVNQKEVNYRLGIWHLPLSHKTKTR